MKPLLCCHLLSAGLLFGITSACPAESPVRIAVLEPVGSCVLYNGRLLKNYHPMRGKIRLENTTDRIQEGVLVPEIVGNLETVYALARQQLTLRPREKKVVWVYWNHAAPLEFAGLAPFEPSRIPAPRWGHALNAAWMDSQGRVLDRAQNVFAVEEDGYTGPERKFEMNDALTARPLSDREAFELRYAGYLKNPAFREAGDSGGISLEINGVKAEKVAGAVGPSGYQTYILRLEASQHAAQAKVTFADNLTRLSRAWLLEPELPRASRLYHLADGKTFAFEIPAASSGAVLVIETTPWRYVPPVSIEEIAASGERQFGPFRSLIQDTEGRPVGSPEEWRRRREGIREKVWKALFVRPEPRSVPFEARVISEEAVGPQNWPNKGITTAYTRRLISLQMRKGERSSVWLLIPPGIGPFPAVIAAHQTVPEGKDETVGLGGFYWQSNFGPFLASRGYVVISPDAPTVGERYDPDQTHAWDTTALTAKNPQWSLIGERLHDNIRMIDYLESLPYVDRSRIGVIGHSMGGESSAFLAAMDDRIAAAVPSCSFTLMRNLNDAADIYALPSWCLLPVASMRKPLQAPPGQRNLPFDFDDLMALWAPRPVFFNEVSQEQEHWNNASQTAQAVLELRKLYRFLGAEERFYAYYIDSTHDFNPWVQFNAFDWLDYWLKGPRNVRLGR